MAWRTCNVFWAGPIENGTMMLRLQAVDGSFDRWFRAHDAVKKEMLATALMSMSSGLRVEAALPDDLHEEGTCDRLYVRRD